MFPTGSPSFSSTSPSPSFPLRPVNRFLASKGVQFQVLACFLIYSSGTWPLMYSLGSKKSPGGRKRRCHALGFQGRLYLIPHARRVSFSLGFPELDLHVACVGGTFWVECGMFLPLESYWSHSQLLLWLRHMLHIAVLRTHPSTSVPRF